MNLIYDLQARLSMDYWRTDEIWNEQSMLQSDRSIKWGHTLIDYQLVCFTLKEPNHSLSSTNNYINLLSIHLNMSTC